MALNKTNKIPAPMQFTLWYKETDREGGKDTEKMQSVALCLPWPILPGSQLYLSTSKIAHQDLCKQRHSSFKRNFSRPHLKKIKNKS